MKYLKRFNESIEQQVYEQFLDTVRDCFLEFEDSGWYWITSPNYPFSASFGEFPDFNYRMAFRGDEYVPSEIRDFIDITGEITSNGEIIWDSKELDFYENTPDDEKRRIKEEIDNFLVAVKRINSETGLDFRFSYNNKSGELRIIIQGRI